MRSNQKVVLLDRDGTINLDPPDERVTRIAEIKLFPDTLEALKLLADNGFKVIIITNQAGIAEGRISEAEFQTIQSELLELIKPSGIDILKTYYCPHAPADNCECSKPKPKMLLQAAEEFDLDLSDLYMVGDTLKDIEAGKSAGTKTILVKTGNNSVKTSEATFVATNLLEATNYIITH